uniref:Probable peptidoglycan glycosyltransferase FtsW n=1 Tax=Candidatus Kentrum sp. MB TaxID=2138164 RepID=A0A451B853_9GAMM|nr:MAG: cell division-specific peptidoglycan biosynthesis regulator FtsW [Candidatus Kentron sp. MB]VFK27745.1 MAG: cell division-specific peptidoglycan biosynthesis regulator FtsW [Candidatus Kentron sp. MB]VFK74417.1 MAG: cell division-specific peptidoglycan biosynthesis regulator FtsW [Candidatus Kentron sp. MB]
MVFSVPTQATFAGRTWRTDSLPDLWLIGAVLLLVGLGLVMVASTSITTADRELGIPLRYFMRQAGYVVFGVCAAWIVVLLPLKMWDGWNGAFFLAFGIILLILVLIPGIGHEVNGSTRWIRFGFFNLQPSEPIKLLFIVYLAGYLVRHSGDVRTLKFLINPFWVLAVIAVFLLLEPDYGAAAVLFTTALGMLFLAGVPFWKFTLWSMGIAVLLVGFILMEPYRLERLTVFVNPWADPFGSGFQLTQALIAIGRGEWFGAGLGSSIQKLFYLPEAHTDFLFAVLAEELGLLGALLVIGLFAFVVWRAFAIARRAALQGFPFGAHLAYGIGLIIGLQAFVNIGVNVGVLPTKGLALPLMSYGGSSMLVNCMAIGLLLRVDRELRLQPRTGI